MLSDGYLVGMKRWEVAACVGGMFCMLSQRKLTRSIRVYCHVVVLDYVVLMESTSSDCANVVTDVTVALSLPSALKTPRKY